MVYNTAFTSSPSAKDVNTIKNETGNEKKARNPN
jgi:hypothetical protein